MKINIFEKIALFSGKSTFPLKREKCDFHTFHDFTVFSLKHLKYPWRLAVKTARGEKIAILVILCEIPRIYVFP